MSLLGFEHADPMRRRKFVALLGGALAASFGAEAQQNDKIPRIGFLLGSSAAVSAPYLDSFRQGLSELGYVEGRNIAIEYRWADGNYKRLPALAADLVRMKVDVIVTSAPPVPMAAKRATSAIPVVFTSAVDPVGRGLVASLARPGGNVTGLANTGLEVVGKHLELLKEIVPNASRVAVLYNPSNSSHAPTLGAAKAAAQALGVQLDVVEARTPSEIERAFAAMRSQRASGVIVLRDAFFFLRRAQIVALAATTQLPAVYGFREDAEAGGLIAYFANLFHMWRQSAVYVDKILKGAKPADLPVEQPTKFELVINVKTAKTLGVTIPASLLARADQVIE